MLNIGEEVRLAACIDTIKDDMQNLQETNLKHETILWLATKLKETNEELKKKKNSV